MEALIKRHFWLVHFFSIALAAFFVAGLTSDFAVDQVREILQENTVKKSVTKQVKGRVDKPKRRSWYSDISQRNLFNSAPPSEETDSSVEDESKEKKVPEGTLPGPYDECKKSDAKVDLHLTMIAEPSSESYATVTLDGKSGIIREGSIFDENYEVAEIQWRYTGGRLVLLKDGNYECVEASTTPKKRGKYKPPTNRGKKTQSKKDPFKGRIKEVSPGRYQVDKALLDEQLADLDSLVRQARVIPHYSKGKQAGFKIVGIRSNSIFRHIGLKSGDVLKSVGGEELTTINKALGLLDKFKTSSNLALDIQRRGKSSTLEYDIR